jgi:hypothetical protein
MLNLKRNMANVTAEYRLDPRIEFHYPVALIGFDVKAHIIDFSVGGFYIQIDSPMHIIKDQKIRLFLKFPEENVGITVKAEVVHQDTNGFGCKLYDLRPKESSILSRYFDMFTGMLPVE